MIRRNILKWHLITSLIVMVPMLMWTISGFLHPLMSSFKPAVKNQALPANEIDSSRISIPLQKALQQNGIQTLNNFRIVRLHKDYYYQVQQPKADTLTYINTQSGSILNNGDQVYAAYLAQRFLSEPITEHKNKNEGHHHATAGALEVVTAMTEPSQFHQAPVTRVKLIRQFDQEYKSSNKLLPVYRIDFDRDDHIRLYIETGADRLSLAMDDRKAAFNIFFSWAHSWSFLNDLGKTKSILLGAFSALSFLTSVFGFYAYYISNRKKIKAISFTHKNRKWHRSLGIVFLTTTLLFSFSGAWHAWNKAPQKPSSKTIVNPSTFKATELNLSWKEIQESLDKKEKLIGISPIKINDQSFWQVAIQQGNKRYKRYFNMQDQQEMKNGDAAYAIYLVKQFTGNTPHNINKTENINAFDHNYSMMNKILPVVQVSIDNGNSYFIETSSGRLAAVTSASDKLERFSFSNLHMHHYWEMWLGKDSGKTVRNAVLMLSTLGLMLIALTGLIIYWRKRFQRKVV
ncbi:PepSY domain-containing protein [Chitinophagaceae bacterium LB-8]|uniref:PepSY domain-containing protein n=1 Tax=Paraflavisolibacter caeni TaxID=2982496 RepID=A0A9X2XUS4_9BACT|nr:PepSY domain-containing protein [Paraflavisolibacter caeni]MCU7548881.1 PepSY domain-containing protein [Paraflavisolibacter caeni]